MSIADKIPHEKGAALGSTFFVVNAFVWLFYSIYTLEMNVNEVNLTALQVQLTWSIYFGALTLSIIAGAMLTNKVGRKQLLIFWTSLGVISPFTLFLLNFAHFPAILLISIIFAVSIGLGMPNCMEYFVRSTSTVVRGRYAGLVFLFSVLGLFFLRVIGGGIELAIFILVVWRLFGFLVVFFGKSFNSSEEKFMKVSYRSIFGQKSFILYFVPWMMFSFVNYLSAPTQISVVGQSMYTEFQLIVDIIGPISAIPAGFLLDYVGRKQAAIAGFVLLGVSYSFLGLYPYALTSWYLSAVFDGVAWGILSVLFVVCIWGELNPSTASDKYYALGVVPFFISESLSLMFTSYFSLNVSPYAIFSFIAFFLFIAVLPLVYAPETLPAKILKDRDLKSYAEKALKKAKKEADKEKKAIDDKSDGDEAKSDTQQPPGYDEARKLAEKYY